MLVVAAVCLSVEVAQAAEYRVIDLGPYVPTAFNDLGQITGELVTGFDPMFNRARTSAFILTPGQQPVLLDPSQQYLGSRGNAINNAGLVAGQTHIGAGFQFDAFRYAPGTGIVHIAPTLEGARPFEATGVNASGQIVGLASSSAGETHAFIQNPGEGAIDLRPQGPLSAAHAINDLGQVTGEASFAQRVSAFVYSSGTGMVEIPGTQVGWAINNSGQVAGQTTDNQAFLYTPGVGVTLIGTLGLELSEARGMNDAGDVVGVAWTPGRGEPQALATFLFTADRGMVDVNSLLGAADRERYFIDHATDINNQGWIVGMAFFKGDGPHGVLLVQCRVPSGLLSFLRG